MWKAVFVLKTFDLCPNLLVMQENGLIRKLRPISKFMTSERGKQIIVIYILLNIWRSKGNRAMKFGKLIEYNVRNIFYLKIIHSFSFSQLFFALGHQSVQKEHWKQIFEQMFVQYMTQKNYRNVKVVYIYMFIISLNFVSLIFWAVLSKFLPGN